MITFLCVRRALHGGRRDGGRPRPDDAAGLMGGRRSQFQRYARPNRLASNSLLEGLVFGADCGRRCGGRGRRHPGRLRGAAGAELRQARHCRSCSGHCRSHEFPSQSDGSQHGHRPRSSGTDGSGRQVSFWCRYVLRQFSTRAGWELQNLLTAARLMIWSCCNDRIARRPLPSRLSRARRCSLAEAHCLSAGVA